MIEIILERSETYHWALIRNHSNGDYEDTITDHLAVQIKVASDAVFTDEEKMYLRRKNLALNQQNNKYGWIYRRFYLPDNQMDKFINWGTGEHTCVDYSTSAFVDELNKKFPNRFVVGTLKSCTSNISTIYK